MSRPPERFLIPVKSLTVPAPWRVGLITLHPGGSCDELIADTPAAQSQSEWVRRTLDSAAEGSLAEVIGVDDVHDAIETVQSSLSVLRLFQASRRTFTETSFGLPGDLYSATIEYIATWEHSSWGGVHKGHFEGYSFSDKSLNDWSESEAFQYLSAALCTRR